MISGIPKRLKIRKNKKDFLSFWLFSILFTLNSQEYNLNSPIDLPLNLSGTFGEFRSSHFHYGLDVTPNKNPD